MSDTSPLKPPRTARSIVDSGHVEPEEASTVPTPPGDPTPEQQSTIDVLRRMHHEEVHSLLAA